MPELDPTGLSVEVGNNISVRTPGLAGTVTVRSPSAGDFRSAEATTPGFIDALNATGIEEQDSIDITNARETSLPVGGAVRSTTFDEPAIELQVPDAGDDWGQFVVHTDEGGVTTFHFARTETGSVDTTRGQPTRTYLIPRTVRRSSAGSQTSRGLVGAIGKKIIKVLAFRLLDSVAGRVGDYFAAKWEAKKRPYRIRSFTPSDYCHFDAEMVGLPLWGAMTAGRALLVLHGTMSQTHTGLGGLSKEFVQKLNGLYGDRVFAFDHYTLSETPQQNVAWFLDQMPDGVTLDIDILCHSRGGLVARFLAERQADLSLRSRTINVGKVVLVAVPNHGTALVDAKYLGTFIDAYTNLLNFIPDNGVTEVLEAIFTIAKQLALGAYAGLDGLKCMLESGDFLATLNADPVGSHSYFALASNYEPADVGFMSFRDVLFDRIFKKDNDLIVPTAGVYEGPGAYFPIADRHVFVTDDHVAHSGFFSNDTSRAKIFEWLSV